MDQLALNFTPERLTRRRDPQTSREAAERSGKFRGRHEALILEALKAGPMTKDEIATATGLTDIQVARRGKEMTEAGLVTIGPETRDGCRVWKRRDNQEG